MDLERHSQERDREPTVSSEELPLLEHQSDDMVSVLNTSAFGNVSYRDIPSAASRRDMNKWRELRIIG